MWFKNLALLRFTEPFTLGAQALEQRLEERRFRPCGSLEPVSLGWTAPLGKDTFPLVHATNGFLMVCLQKEEKILPASVVNECVAERVEEIEERQGRQVRRKEKDSLRDEVLQDLLPRAFSHSRRTYAYIDPKGGWLVVDSASAKKTDELTSLLRQCLESLPVVPFATRERPAAILSSWLAEDAAPPDVTLESECELRSPEEDGGIVRCRRHDLGAPEIQNHLEAGKEVIKLAITWGDRLSFVLDEALTIKKLRFLELVQDEAADVETADPAERFDADFAVMSLELANFLPRLAELFGGEDLQTK
jgi:recombination associated protein RdgC